MTHPTGEPLSKRTLAGRIVGGVWAINFLLLITETFTYRWQSPVSVGLAIGTMALLYQR